MNSDMEELNSKVTPCEVQRRNGDTYESELHGVFQLSEGGVSKPVAVVKLESGLLGIVDVSAVKLRPAPYVQRKDGTRLYRED